MNAPIFSPIWHCSAQVVKSQPETFAMHGIGRHCFQTGHAAVGRVPRSQCCFPSPSQRSGQSLVGPTPLGGRVGNRLLPNLRNLFQSGDIAVESAAITTKPRGSTQCASRLSFSHFSPPLWLAACRTLRRAARLVPLRASSLLTRPMATCLPALSWAALRVLQPAASMSASAPATDRQITAFGRPNPSTRTIRANCPGGPLLFAA